MPVWPVSLPLLLFAVLATVPISVVTQKPLIYEHYNSLLFGLKHWRDHTREPWLRLYGSALHLLCCYSDLVISSRLLSLTYWVHCHSSMLIMLLLQYFTQNSSRLHLFLTYCDAWSKQATTQILNCFQFVVSSVQHLKSPKAAIMNIAKDHNQLYCMSLVIMNPQRIITSAAPLVLELCCVLCLIVLGLGSFSPLSLVLLLWQAAVLSFKNLLYTACHASSGKHHVGENIMDKLAQVSLITLESLHLM